MGNFFECVKKIVEYEIKITNYCKCPLCGKKLENIEETCNCKREDIINKINN